MHISLIEIRREDFDVAAAAVDLLLVFDSVLDDQILAFIAERLKPDRGGVEAGILAGLQT